MSYALILFAIIIIVIASLSSVSGTVSALQGLVLTTQYAIIFIAAVSLKTSLYSLSIIAVAVIGGFLLQQIVPPLYDEAIHVERFLQGKDATARNFRSRVAYVRIRRELGKPLDMTNSDALILAEWLDKYRHIFNNLPATHPAETRNNTMGFHKRAQLKLLRIADPKQNILFILHEDTRADAETEVIDFEGIPTVDEVLKVVGKSIPRENVIVCLDNIHRGIRDGFTGEPSIKNRWAYLYLPSPMSKFNFNGMLRTYLNLEDLT